MLPSSGLKIGRVFGIDIVIHASWIFILALFGLSLGDTFRRWPVENGKSFPGGAWPWIIGFLTAIVLFATLLAHELSHSYIAKRNGIPIRRITLFLFGGVAEMSEDVTSAGTEFRMAVAGPLTTFVFAGIFYLLFLLAINLKAGPILIGPLFSLTAVSLFIGVFNLLPGFPLDGGRVLRSILWWRWNDLEKSTRVASISGQVIAVMLAAGGVIWGLVDMNLLVMIWPVIIGLFLFQLAKASYRQTLFRLAAADTKVGDIMFTNVPVIDSRTTLTTLRNNYFAQYHLPIFPVGDHDGTVTGIVGLEDLAAVAPSEWDILNAGRIARPLSDVRTVAPDTPLDKVLRGLMGGEEYMLVTDGDRVAGLITRDELSRYVEMRLKLVRKRQR